MSQELNPSRRAFLKTSATVGGGLVIGFYLPARMPSALAQTPAPKTYPPNAFIQIAKDNNVSIVINKCEMGQGVFTSMSQLIAEELDCDWTSVKAIPAPVDPVYNHTVFPMQMTGGSTSLISSYDQYRKIGATARAMLIGAAAQQWGVEPKSCATESGFVVHKAKGKLSYGELSERANAREMPNEVPLKDPKQFKFIGHSVPRLDAAEKSTGRAIYGLDVRIPNMARVVVLRPPVFGAKLESFDAAAAKKIKGVLEVVRVGDRVAVLAKNTFAARQGRDAVKAKWITKGKDEVSSASLMSAYREFAKKPTMVAENNPDAIKLVDSDKHALHGDFEFPYLSHASMEPLNCTVRYDGKSAELWSGHQMPSVDRTLAAQVLGLAPEKVKVNAVYAGGSFGRRGSKNSDYVVEACEIAKVVKRPIQVVWTREDDMKGGFYRPLALHRARISTDAKGLPKAWHHTIVSQSIMGGGIMAAMFAGKPDPTVTEGVSESRYAIKSMHVDLNMPDGDVPVLWYRSVGHTHTAFVMETLMDELAHRAKVDPIAYRRQMLAQRPRHLAVLDLLSAKTPINQKAPKGRAYGLAIHESFSSVVGHVVEVSLHDKHPKVHRVWSAAHCGRLVNPEGARTQIAGGVIFALSAALYGGIRLEKGETQNNNFHTYPMVRMKDAPSVEVFFVETDDHPSGLGEPGVPPLAPAIANALFKLTGHRTRKLPFIT